MTMSVQLKLRGWSIIDNMQENWNQMDTDKPGNIFTQFLSAVVNFFGNFDILPALGNIFKHFLSAVVNFFENLIGSFDILPALDQIRHWLHVAAPYILASTVLILCIFCFICFFSCIVSLFSRLFVCIFFIIKGIFSAVCAIFRFLLPCLVCGGTSAVKMMKAPGMAGVMIVRAAFEASPQIYFAGLRMLA